MRRPLGFSIVELMVSLVIAALLLGSLNQLLAQSWRMSEANETVNRHASRMQFALERMTRYISNSNRLLLPFDSTQRNLLAITLPPMIDIDGDGQMDADNDGDGRFDEDPGSDVSNDGAPGLQGIDDDGDGQVDEDPTLWWNDDEQGGINDDGVDNADNDGDGWIDEDPSADLNGDGEPGIAGVDDDGDGLIDEGIFNSEDDDEDGLEDEDWYDAVVWRFENNTLIERLPMPFDVTNGGGVNGDDYVENVLLTNVTGFQVRRIPTAREELIEILIQTTENGQSVNIETFVRLGGAL